MNKRKIEERLDYKTMVFIVPRFVQDGLIRTELRFPHEGRIVDVYATCGVTGSTDTHLDIEKCSDTDYNETPSWSSIFSSDLFVDANKKSSKTSTNPYSLSSDVVNVDDHFRVNVVNAGEGVEDITVEVKIEISTNV